jgi:CDP-glucose 4,6-dehydratase
VAIRSSTLEGLGVNPDFWRGKRVLLTGHTGFKGSWLSLWLQWMGVDLLGYSLPAPTNPSLFKEARVDQGMTSVIGDIRDLVKLQSVFNQFKPEIVIHMAAQPLVLYSFQNPVETYSTNVMGTVHLMECVRNTPGVKVVINITTDKCYENKGWIWGYREIDPMGGYDPYSNSKGCAELVSDAYRSSYFNVGKYEEHGVGLATVRAGNVIGGGDWAADRLIPDILSAFENSKLVEIRNPHAIRPWQHVMEPLRGYLSLAEHLYKDGPAYSEAWNFGPNDEDAKPVSWIVEQMAAMWGQSAQWQVNSSQQPHEAHFLKLDISKVRMRLNWCPAIRLNEALSMIVHWAKQRQAGVNIRELTLGQIQNYHNLTL